MSDKNYNIVWEGEPRPEHENLIRHEVDELLENGLPQVSDLIFHTIVLSEDYAGPSIGVSGVRNSNDVLVEYVDKTTWVTSNGEQIDPA